MGLPHRSLGPRLRAGGSGEQENQTAPGPCGPHTSLLQAAPQTTENPHATSISTLGRLVSLVASEKILGRNILSSWAQVPPQLSVVTVVSAGASGAERRGGSQEKGQGCVVNRPTHGIFKNVTPPHFNPKRILLIGCLESCLYLPFPLVLLFV